MPHIVWLLIAAAALPAAVSARTWFVEKDGSGDYTVIQEAVNAAADGDTIRIGPGRFNEMTNLGSVWEYSECVVNLIGRELTLIGSGEETIV